MRMQEAEAGVPGWGSRWQRGSSSCMSILGLERASVYSRLHRSCSRASHSSLHSCRWRGTLDASSHRGKTWKQSERTANWEHWSDIWAEVPIMVKAAGSRGGREGEPAPSRLLPRPAGVPTCDAVLALALHLWRLHVDALVPDEASAGDASVRLAETRVT